MVSLGGVGHEELSEGFFGLGLNTPRWSFSFNGLHGPQKEVNEMM